MKIRPIGEAISAILSLLRRYIEGSAEAGTLEAVPVGSLYVTVMNDNGDCAYKPIFQSPFFTALRDDNMDYYDKFRSGVLGKYWPDKLPFIVSGVDYLSLVASLKNGFIFDPENPVVITREDGKLIVKEGQHRLCALLYLLGSDAKLKLANGRFRPTAHHSHALCEDGERCWYVIEAGKID